MKGGVEKERVERGEKMWCREKEEMGKGGVGRRERIGEGMRCIEGERVKRVCTPLSNGKPTSIRLV